MPAYNSRFFRFFSGVLLVRLGHGNLLKRAWPSTLLPSFPVVHLIFWHSVVGCFEISHFLCELPSCWSVRLSLESPVFQAFFFIMEPQAKRFAGVCDSDVDQVIAGRVPQATKEATSGWLRVFHQFADKQETRLNYQTYDKAELCFLLSRLYVGARRSA